MEPDRLQQASSRIDVLLKEAEDDRFSPFWPEMLLVNKRYLAEDLAVDDHITIIYTTLDYLGEVDMPLLVSSMYQSEIDRIKALGEDFRSRWQKHDVNYVKTADHPHDLISILGDASQELADCMDVMRQTALRAGPQNEAEANEISMWISGIQQQLGQVQVLETSYNMLTEKDECHSRDPNSRCCEAHSVMGAMEQTYKSISDLWFGAPFEVEDDIQLPYGIITVSFPSGARYPIIVSVSKNGAYEKAMDTLNSQRADHRANAEAIETVYQTMDTEMYDRRYIANQFDLK